jgi:ABC-2 type transport system permease protein
MTPSSLGTLVGWRFRADMRAIRGSDWAQRGTAAAFFAVGGALMGGLFYFFSKGFASFLSEPYFGPVAIRYIFELSFLTILFLGTISFIYASVPLLFDTKDAAFTSAVPVPPETFFAYRFLGALVLSSWPLVVVGIPAILALGIVAGAGPSYYLMAAAILALFLMAMGIFSALLSFGFASITHKLPAIVLNFLQLAAFFSLAIWGMRTFVSRDIFLLVQQAGDPSLATSSVASLRELFSLAPSHYLVEPLLGILPLSMETNVIAMHGSPVPSIDLAYGDVGIFAAAIAIMGVAAVLAIVVKRAYLPLLQRYREGTFVAKAGDASPSFLGRSPFPRVFKWGHGFLFEKDMLTFFRSPTELSRAASLMVILVLYVLGISGISVLEPFTGGKPFAIATTFVFAASGYLALTTGLRFAFPSLSLEGRSAWVLWSSPVHAHEFFSWKFFFWSALVTFVMESVTWASASMLRMPVELAAFLGFAVFCTSISVIAITLGQGSIFPDFSGHRGADSLTTSPAGLVATGIGLAYVWIVARYLYGFATGLLVVGRADVIGAFGILIVSLTVIIAYWSLARRRMDSLEVA